jgi:hypothetical protein
MNNDKKLYIGSVTRDGSLVRVKSGNAEDQLPLCLNIRNHSPTGFAWTMAVAVEKGKNLGFHAGVEGRSLWFCTYCSISSRGAPPHEAAK